MASRMLESSDDESDFEGFSEIGSDIDVPIVSDDESDGDLSDDSDSEDENTSNWSSNFTNLRVRIPFNFRANNICLQMFFSQLGFIKCF